MTTCSSKKLEDTQFLAQAFAKVLQPGINLLLEGPLGAGKTAFTQALGKALSINRPIKSPTYTLVKTYPLDQGRLVHIDAYRLEEGGSDSVDFDFYFEPQNICLIEWPQFMKDYLPSSYLRLVFELKEDGERGITLSVSDEADAKHRAVYKEWLDQVGDRYES